MSVFDAPENYDDPFWINQAKNAEDNAGLPDGSLQGILYGERSNHGSSNKLGTQTPFQITQKTRDDILDKDGYDAFESPENAAKAAAQVLKDGFNKNPGDEQLAYSHYSGFKPDSTGLDSYYNRAKIGLKKLNNSLNPSDANASESNAIPKLTDEQKFKLQDAYTSGKMSEQQANDFSSMFPDLVQDIEPPGIQTPTLTDEQKAKLKDAYDSGKMDAQQKSDFSAHFPELVMKPSEVVGKESAVPVDATGDTLSGFVNSPQVIDPAVIPTASQVYTPALEIGGGVVGEILGGGPTPLGVAGATLGFAGGQQAASLIDRVRGVANPTETPQNLTDVALSTAKSLNEGAQMAMGGPIIGKVAAPILAPVANRIGGMISREAADTAAKAGEIGKQSLNPDEVMTTLQKALKGDSDAKEILASKAAPDAEMAKVYDRLRVEMPIYANFTDKDIKDIVSYGLSEKGSAAANEWEAAAKAANERATSVINSLGSGLTKDELSGKIEASVKADLEATSNQLEESSKQIESSISKAGDDARSTLTNLGASEDLDAVVNNARQTAEDVINASKEKTKLAYDGPEGITNTIGSGTDAPASKTLDALKTKLDTEYKGDESQFSNLEKRLWKNLSPTIDSATEEPIARTYGVLDKEKKAVTASKNANDQLYSDSSLGEKKYYESLLAEDQAAAAEKAGVGERLKQVHADVGARKGLESDVRDLYGRTGKASKLTPKINSAIKNAANGDGTNLNTLLESLPAEHQGPAVSSSFLEAVKGPDGAIDPTKFIRTYEGLQNNRALFDKAAGVMGEGSATSLENTYKQMKGVLEAQANISNAKIKLTGSVSDKITDLINSGIRKAANGDSTTLEKLMKVTPDALKKDSLQQAISSFIRDPKTGELSFDKFSKFYRDMRENNPRMYSLVGKNWGEKGYQTMDDTYRFSQNMIDLQNNIAAARSAEGGLVGNIKENKKALGALLSGIGRVVSLGFYHGLHMPVSASSVSGSLQRTFGINPIMKAETAAVLASPEFKSLVGKAAMDGYVPPQVVRKLASSKEFANAMKGSSQGEREEFLNAAIKPILIEYNSKKDKK